MEKIRKMDKENIDNLIKQVWKNMFYISILFIE
jgi:hypothetical protein